MTRVQKFEHRILTALKIPVTTGFFWLSLLGLLSSATLCYSARTVTSETSAAILARSLETSVKQSQSADTSEARSTRSPSAMLVGQRVYTSRDAARHSRGSGTPVYRCVRLGMGSPPSHSPGEWCLTTRGTKLHINQFEMMALLNALLAIKKQLTGMTMQLMSDNATVVSYLRKQGVMVSASPSGTGSAVTSTRRTYYCSGQACPGKKNVLADLLSRRDKIIHTEWTLYHSLVTALCITWDRPNIDPFATHLNHRLPVFVSPMADPQAVDVDALSIPWNGMYAYASPHS